MKKIWIVARWEFVRTVCRIGFIVTLIGLPLAHFGLAALIGMSLRHAVENKSTRLPVAVVDEHRILTSHQAELPYVFQDSGTAMDLLRGGSVGAVYVLERDYLATGKVRSYAKPPKSLLQIGRHLEQRERASSLLRKGLAREGDDRSRRVVEPIVTLDAYRVERDAIRPETPFAVLGVLAGPFGVCFVLGLAIFLSANLLQQAMGAELQNRMLEVLMTLVTPTQLLTGKVLGLSAAGLLQVSIYLVTAAIAMPMLVGTGLIAAETILWSGAAFLAGFALFATILAGMGAVVRDTQEHMQIASVCLLLAAAPFFFLTHIGGSTPSMLSRVLTWFPPTAPVTLLLRMGSDGVGTVERSIVVALIVASSAAVLAVSALLFEQRMLSGQPFNVRRLVALVGGRL